MVLLIDHRRVAWSAIHRALRMSDALDTELAIVLAIPPEPDGTYPARVIRHLVDLVHLRRPRRGFALELAHGGVRSEGRAIARRIAPQLVVVDPELAPDACRLADDLAAPVIVAREARARGEWVAASDMQHLTFPVLSLARDLAGSLHRGVVYFHNARPVHAVALAPAAGTDSVASLIKLQEDAADSKRARLHRLACDADGRSVVTRVHDTARALLDIAREREADMVVVGHRRHSWLAHMLGRRTAERVASDSRRSVLVIPLPGAL